jgi:hypothetical protein
LVPASCSSFGLSLALPFCLPCDGSGHCSFIEFLWCSYFHPLKKKQINNPHPEDFAIEEN